MESSAPREGPLEFIDLQAQRKRIEASLKRRIEKVLVDGKFILGEEVAELEKQLAARVDMPHCVSVANGTDALQVLLMALGVGPGDEVVTPAFSFFAVAEVVQLLGARPVLVDIDPQTYLLDPASLEDAMSPKVKAIIPVSLFGQCPDMAAIQAVADRHGIPVIEDGAQSFGARQGGRPSCGLSDFSTTSFFPSKPLGCYGDGGAIFVKDSEVATTLRSLRAHGQKQRYQHVRTGVNSRLDTLQAAILLSKLEVFDDEIQARESVARMYAKGLPRSVRPPALLAGNVSVYAQYTIEVEKRDTVRAQLEARGIPVAVHYPRTIADQEALAGRVRCVGDLKHSQRAASRVLSLPFHPYLQESQVARICRELGSSLV